METLRDTVVDAPPDRQTMLRLEVLGGFAASFARVAVLTRKTQALLACLALAEGRPMPRAALAAMFWELQGEERARNNLRQSLSAIRAALGPAASALMPAGRDAVALDPGLIAVDACDFERAARAADPEDLRRAMILYRGELLAGFEAVAAPGFQAWRNAEAVRLKALAIETLLSLLQQGGPEEEAVARRLLELDPLQEPAHRTLMRRHVRHGHPGLALEQYERCRDLLQRQLGRAPDPETEALRLDLAGPDAAPDGPPSLLVLPFASLSPGPDESAFGLGIAEEITHALARIRWLRVLGRSSELAAGPDALEARGIGRARGVGYVLNGAVRRAGTRRRITVRLLEVASGRTIWSERFDEVVDEVFALQDAVTRAVMAAIEPTVERAEMARAAHGPRSDSALYALLFRAVALRIAITREASCEAVALLRQALVLDPGFAPAQAQLLLCHTQRATQGWSDPDEIEDGIRLARAAYVAHGDDPYILEAVVVALITLALDAEGALEAANRALTLHPNSPWIRNAAGWANLHAGDAEAAARHLSEAIRLDPFAPEGAYSHAGLSLAHVLAGRPEEGLASAQRALRERPDLASAHRGAITALVQLGRQDDAAAAARAFMQVSPGAARVMATELRQGFRDPAQAELLIYARRAAGLPE